MVFWWLVSAVAYGLMNSVSFGVQFSTGEGVRGLGDAFISLKEFTSC